MIEFVIRDDHCLDTQWNFTNDFTGSLERKGKKGVVSSIKPNLSNIRNKNDKTLKKYIYIKKKEKSNYNMTDTNTARTIVGIIGNVIAFGLFSAPIPTMVKICKMKSVSEFKPDPYVATVLNCMMWTFYGLPFVQPDSLLVITINGAGLVMELVYVVIFFIFATSPVRKRITIAMVIEVIFMAVVVFCTLYFLHTTKQRSMLVGILCIIFNIIMYASPLTVMALVIKTKSVKYMPFFLSLANFMNGAIWIVYACLKFDLYILIPNALGCLSGTIQFILYALYYKTTNWSDDDEDKEKSNLNAEIELSQA
ncbi:hypothetical protein IGI04_008580 [Brassica rapa subsp. trilocularis]|uniref:Bidirectional sugar transporter SWEET n=1 Tax=Brassica rapa subsp. trilocularis TaxID=1813537 RepID=A0ABQ7NN26_BRACM|nr:hypothetical protein IGI04_008580 [Brassica rapa subsp. trilocularis]